jgi:hypothetical protein
MEGGGAEKEHGGDLGGQRPGQLFPTADDRGYRQMPEALEKAYDR